MKLPAVRLCAVFSLALLAGCEIGVENAPPDPASRDPGSRTAGDAAPSIETPPVARPPRPKAVRVARGNLRFVEGYRKGYEQAARETKPMLLFFTAQWCQFCHQMAEEAFTHPQVVGLAEHFVCILIDADVEPEVCRQFQVTGYPTIQFLSPRGVPLERIVGKKPGHQLMMSMQAALQNVARRSHDDAEPAAR